LRKIKKRATTKSLIKEAEQKLISKLEEQQLRAKAEGKADGRSDSNNKWVGETENKLRQIILK
jgi:hypothetical protein